MCRTDDMPVDAAIDASHHGAERWFYGGEPPPDPPARPHPVDPLPPAPERSPSPERVREPDQGREAPIQAPRSHPTWSAASAAAVRTRQPAAL